jgi:large repetitive protein
LLEEPAGFAARILAVFQDSAGITGVATGEERGDLVFNGAGDFLLTGFAGADGTTVRLTVEQFQQVLRSGAFVNELNELRRQLQNDFDLDRSTSVAVAGVSLGVSVAYVLWMIRGSVLVGSYLSALPAWRLLDPLPVLAQAGAAAGRDEDEEEDAFDPDEGEKPDPLRGYA